jgi:hypothetical protein
MSSKADRAGRYDSMEMIVCQGSVGLKGYDVTLAYALDGEGGNKWQSD